MVRFILIVIAIFILFFWEGNSQENQELHFQENLESITSFFEKVGEDFQTLLKKFDIPWLEEPENQQGKEGQEQEGQEILLNPIHLIEEKNVPKTPNKEHQAFSVFQIALGDPKEKVEQLHGKAKRISMNEYGSMWHSYHQDYRHFFMVSYDEENRVNGIYTNSQIQSDYGFQIGSTKTDIEKIYGKSLKGIQKQKVLYIFPEERDFEVYFIDEAYVTFFFDKLNENKLTSLLIISEDLEREKQAYYAETSEELKIGFEWQLFDLTNAARVLHGLKPLTWDDQARESARKHSLDMAVNNYFSHTNLEGKSPFDRMKEEEIIFLFAGENLAYGQTSSIFAFEGLMNSQGHRDNILHPDYEYLGIGVAFNNKDQPYYTQNFFSK